MCQIQIDLLEATNDPLLYSPTWIETLGAIETFTLHFATFHDTLRPNFWSIARCRHEGWYDKASQPRLFTNFYRPPSWPTGFSGIPVTLFPARKTGPPMLQTPLPPPSFYPTSEISTKYLFSPYFSSLALSSTLPSISSSDSTFLNFLPLLIFSPLTIEGKKKLVREKERRNYLSDRERRIDFTRLWHATITTAREIYVGRRGSRFIYAHTWLACKSSISMRYWQSEGISVCSYLDAR